MDECFYDISLWMMFFELWIHFRMLFYKKSCIGCLAFASAYDWTEIVTKAHRVNCCRFLDRQHKPVATVFFFLHLFLACLLSSSPRLFTYEGFHVFGTILQNLQMSLLSKIKLKSIIFLSCHMIVTLKVLGTCVNDMAKVAARQCSRWQSNSQPFDRKSMP